MTGTVQPDSMAQQILKLVEKTPGINAQVLAAKMGVTPHALSSALNTMTKRKKMIRTGERGCGVRGGGYNGGYHYYPLGYGAKEAEARHRAAQRAMNEVFETARRCRSHRFTELVNSVRN